MFIVGCMLLSLSPMLLNLGTRASLPRWMTPGQDHLIDFNTTSSFDFVVSRYHEPARVVAQQINHLYELPSIKSQDVRVIVYSTGEDNIDDFRATLQHALHHSLEVIIEPRKNVGREAAAYLHHILYRYDNLSDHTLFMQAEMDNPHLLQQRVKDYLIPQTGFLSLSSTQEYCSSIKNCWDHSRWGEDPEILGDIYTRANPHAVATDFTLTYRGQFIASRARIQGQEKQFAGHVDELRECGAQ
ncbi:hypothetical protein E4T39_04038 [Aureobasidium subglaciale]|nr:hypothetical protein E4T39_04038 [Aureobasidium subglaciale]